MSSPRVIKKYPNRRLYDTAQGTYITLEDVKKLVFDHAEFQVIDAHTKKDITQNTLLQIIIEQEATNAPLFTTAVLQDFIRFYHEKSQTIFSQYLEQSMRFFIQQKEFFKNQWQSYQTLFSDPALMQAFKMQKIWPAAPRAEPDKKLRKNTVK